MAALNYGDYGGTGTIIQVKNYASSNDSYGYDTTTCGSTWKTYSPTWTSAATDTTSTWFKCYENWYESDRLYTPSKSPETKLREIIASRQAPAVHSRERWRLHRSKQQCPDEREARARQTLRRVIGDDKYRSFLVNGFVTVRNPKSGLSFQIFPGHGITCVFDKGKMVDRLCVVLEGDFPPTDSRLSRLMSAL
jgi:hypothetical protein